MSQPLADSLSLYHFFPGKPWETVAQPQATAPAPVASCEAISWRKLAEDASPLDGCLVTLPAEPAVFAALADVADVHVECLLPITGPLDADALAASVQPVIDGPSRGTPVHVIAGADDVTAATLEAAHKLLRKTGILYSYIRGAPGHASQNTYCHDCGAMMIERDGDHILSNRILMGKCPFCYVDIPGRWVSDPRMPG